MAAQALIPIPFVGAAVGVGCASLLTKGKNWCFSPDLSALMGQRVPAHTLLNQTTDSKNAARQEAQNGLQQFFDGASIRKEDCHSLFRSLAAGILQSGDYAKIREALRGLPEIWGSYAVANALESLDQLEHNGTTIHQIMNDKKLSNAWVKSLRRLSTAWWRNNSEIAKKRLHPHAESLLGHTILDKDLPDAIQKYLETIDDMDDGFLLGGDPELEALSTILNRPIVFIDAAKTVSSDKLSLVRIFKSTQSQFRYSASTDLRNDHKKETLFLLFNNNHYDVLFPNQSWLDECKRKAAIPLMGQLVPPHTLFAPPADGKNMVALHRLEQFFDGALIKGDGHCLFRSLLAGLLKDGNFAKLREAVRGLPQGIVPQEASRTLESLDRLERNQTTVHGIVNDRELSNAWVSVLRRISTAWWRRSSNETKELFRPQLENFLRRTISVNELPQALEEYLKAIENMDENILFGSEPELLALSTALSMPIAVINATETIRSGMVEVLSFSELAQESVSIPSSENLLQLFPGALFVLFQTNHYNALFPKKH